MAVIENQPEEGTSPSALSNARFLTGLSIFFERLWPLLIPLTLVFVIYSALAWFGLFRAMPDQTRYMLGAAMLACMLAALYPLLGLRFPRPWEITERLERANQLEHQPLAVQSDRPAGDPDPVAEALWKEHQRRMAEKLRGAGPDTPRPAVSRLDPFALRAVPMLLAAVALAFSFGATGGRITDIFYGAPPPPKIPPRIDAWVTPPAYTGRAPVFLTASMNAGTKSFSVPVNSEITVRVTGGSGTEIAKLGASALSLAGDVKSQVQEAAAAGAPAKPSVFTGKLLADGQLSLVDGETVLNSWSFQAIADQPPRIQFEKEPERALNGTITLTYKGTDDYGIASAQALISPEKQAPNARPLFGAPEVKLSVPGRKSKDGIAKTSKDISEHPWAGAPVTLSLSALDDAKQEGRSPTKSILLPERIFTNMLAAALIEQRRLLALDANAKRRVLDLLDALTMRPDDTIKNPSHFLGLYTARERLALAKTDDQLREVVAYLWEVANVIENSGMTEAQKRLKQAQENLAKALENGASDEEIAKLTQELREAMNEYMRELAEQARKNPNSMAQIPPDAKMLSQSEIDQMLKKMEELAKQGARDQAQELLSQLNEMMNNLQMGQAQGQQQGEGQGSAMNEQLNKLGEMMRRQQELMDQTQKLDQSGEGGQEGEDGQGENGEGQQGQNGQGNGEGQQPGQSFGGLQGKQGQLKRDLEGMMKALRDLGLDPGKAFGDAGKSMGQAENELGRGDGGEALADQSDALDALRKGGQGLMEQMQQAMGQEGGGMQPGQRQRGNSEDPLGRPRATTGPDLGPGKNLVPDDIDIQRAREILDAIRKRLGGALSPDFERNYLERLLKFD
jgi:uncharacterized protein (TIGR02302 family)